MAAEDKKLAMEIIRTDGSTIDGDLAATVWQRLRGLIGTDSGQTHDRALVFRKCSSIHTLGMRYPLDVAFVDAAGVVRKTVRSLGPNRLVGIHPHLRRHSPFTAVERESSPTPWLIPGEHVRIGPKGCVA